MTQATYSTIGQVLIAGDLVGSGQEPWLKATGVTPVVSPTVISKSHIDIKGRHTWAGLASYSDIASIIPVATTIADGTVQIGQNINIAAGSISIPTASTSVKGLAKIGSGFYTTGGVLSIDETLLPVATDTIFGLISAGTGLTVSGGYLNYSAAGPATNTTKGVVCTVGLNSLNGSDGLTIADSVLSAVPATNSTKGIVKFGIGFEDSVGGEAQVNKTSSTVYGLLYGVNTAYGLSIASGILEHDSSVLAIASGSVAGKVSPGSGFVVSGDGTLSISTAGDANTSTKGTVQIGTGFSVSAGVVSVNISSDTQKGLVQVDDAGGLSISSGIMDVNLGTSSVFGTVKSSTTQNITIDEGNINTSYKVSHLDKDNRYTYAQVTALVTNNGTTGSFAPTLPNTNCRLYNLTGNITLNTPNGMIPGQVCTFIIAQDATGGRTLTLNSSVYKTNQTITLSTAPNAIDILTMIVKDTNTVYVLFAPGF